MVFSYTGCFMECVLFVTSTCVSFIDDTDDTNVSYYTVLGARGAVEPAPLADRHNHLKQQCTRARIISSSPLF